MNNNRRTFFMTLAASGSLLATSANAQAKADEEARKAKEEAEENARKEAEEQEKLNQPKKKSGGLGWLLAGLGIVAAVVTLGATKDK